MSLTPPVSLSSQIVADLEKLIISYWRIDGWLHLAREEDRTSLVMKAHD